MGQQQSFNLCLVYYPRHSCAYLIERPPQIAIDNSLVQFSGLDSNAVLQSYMSSVDVSDLPTYTEKLGSALGGVGSIPNAVGLGALVISMVLELIVGKKDQTNTQDILRRVFAEEKASEIRDLMDEYIRRLKINLRNSQLQLADTRRIEVLLSAQLTRLKNSMLTDGHISPRALRHWVNGAAFHTQMLIHQARLEGRDGSRATAAVNLYQQDLDKLNDKYRTHVSDFSKPVQTTRGEMGSLACNMELAQPRQYFLDLKNNIQTLINQHNSFTITVNS